MVVVCTKGNEKPNGATRTISKLATTITPSTYTSNQMSLTSETPTAPTEENSCAQAPFQQILIDAKITGPKIIF